MTQKDSQTPRQAALQAALLAFESSPIANRPSVNSMANKFGVPETTLRRAIANGGPLRRSGPPKILTDHEETELVGYCINLQKLGFGLTRSGVNHCVMEILRINNRPHPFGEKGPGDKWWKRFMKDHSELSFRTPQALSEARAQKANAAVVKDHFVKLQQVIQENSLTAGRIWMRRASS